MITSINCTARSIASPLALLTLLSISACGGGIGGEPPKQAMNLSQVNLSCQLQPGESCDKLQATVMLYADITDQRPLWEEKPAVGGSKAFERVKPIKQADGSWIMDFTLKSGLPAGTYVGTVDFSVFVNPFPGTPNYQPRTASYSIVVAAMKGNLSPLQALAGAGDWEGTNGNAAHTGQVPVTLDATKFTRRWTWQATPGSVSTKSSPVLAANGLVYFTQEDSAEDPANQGKSIYSNRLMALSENDSSIVWTSEQKLGNSLGAPGVSGNRIVMADKQTAYTYDAISGARLASVRQPNTNGLLTDISRLTPPTLFGGNAYVGGNNDVMSLDATTAANRWSTSLRLPFLSSAGEWTPAVNASTVYANVAGKLTAFNIGDGTPRFSVAVPDQNNNVVLRQAPVLVDDNTVLLINRLPDASYVVDNSLTLVDVGSRKVRWTVSGKFRTQPVVAAGVVYIANDSSKLLEARSVQDGTVLWSWSPADVGEDGVSGNFIVTNNLLFVAGAKGTYAIDLNSHKAVWSFRMGGTLSLSRNGVLYIRNYLAASNQLVYLTAINLR